MWHINLLLRETIREDIRKRLINDQKIKPLKRHIYCHKLIGIRDLLRSQWMINAMEAMLMKEEN